MGWGVGRWGGRTCADRSSQLAENLMAELDFVLGVVDDPLLAEHGRRIAELVRRGTHEMTGVTFERE